MAWLSVLALPIRSNYATDSAAMLGKALILIAAVMKEEADDARRGGARSCQLRRNRRWR